MAAGALQFPGQYVLLVRDITGQRTLVVKGLTQDTTIDMLISALQPRTGIPEAQQRLVFARTSLQFGRTFRDYGIPSESVLILLVRLRGNGHCFHPGYLFPVAYVDALGNSFDRPFLDQHGREFWSNVALTNVTIERADGCEEHCTRVDIPLGSCHTEDVIGFVLEALTTALKFSKRPTLFMVVDRSPESRVSITTNRDLAMIPATGVRFIVFEAEMPE